MLQAIGSELAMRAPGWKVPDSESSSSRQIKTIYFGGGTPSLLAGNEVKALIDRAKAHYNVVNDPEITLECNPDDCSDENLSDWKTAGVTRLSIGIQSFTDKQLSWMNRTHTADQGMEAVKRAKKRGFHNLTVDLMYGLPGLSLKKWEKQLRKVISLDVDHISAYCLTVEEKTPLAKWVKAGVIHPVDADQQSEQFELLVSVLAEAGFEQYEISNFARNKQYSMHNSAYWTGEHYLGIGPSAHGFNGNERYWNRPNNAIYLKEIQEGRLPETVEELSAFDRFNERLLIGLRTQWGVHKSMLFDQLQPQKGWFSLLESWKEKGDLLETETHYILTQPGRLLADAIASDLFVLKD